ncbi:MAG: DUF975 family protein [Clostridia bacterium]|nr:DUF975 family protein [Clostridia bacterium]
MTVREIKKEANDTYFSAHRFKAMPAYGVAFFVIVNILLLSSVIYAFLASIVGVHIFVAVIIAAYCALLLILVLCLSGQFSYSVDEYFLSVSGKENNTVSFAFGGFRKNNFVRTMLARLLGFFVTLVLTCFAIVPGVIFGIITSMTYYVMKNDPKIGVTQAMRKSAKLMKKHGMQYFGLGFSFLGWFLLCIITLGLGFIFVLPYFNCCKAIFYKRVLSGEAVESEGQELFEADDLTSDGESTAETIRSDESVVCLPYDDEVIIDGGVQMEDTDSVIVEQVSSDPIVELITPESDVSVITETPSEFETVDDGGDNAINNVEKTETIIVDPRSDETPIEAEKVVETDNNLENNSHSRDAIKKRIEQLKRERNAHTASARPQRPSSHDNIKSQTEQQHTAQKPIDVDSAHNDLPKREKKSDEFAPEKIEVEIVED